MRGSPPLCFSCSAVLVQAPPAVGSRRARGYCDPRSPTAVQPASTPGADDEQETAKRSGVGTLGDAWTAQRCPFHPSTSVAEALGPP